MRILIAEDEARIARFLERELKANGFASTVMEDGVSAQISPPAATSILLILDVGLPRMDGFQVLKALRGMDVQVPILMVTACTGVDDTVQGLEGGANDYIAKPLRAEELLARVKLRAPETAAEAGTVSSDVLELGDLSLDLRTRIASSVADDQPRSVELSSREFTMARIFLENPNQILTRDLLLSKVWGRDDDGALNIVGLYVGYLRSKLGARRLVTVRGAAMQVIELMGGLSCQRHGHLLSSDEHAGPDDPADPRDRRGGCDRGDRSRCAALDR